MKLHPSDWSSPELTEEPLEREGERERERGGEGGEGERDIMKPYICNDKSNRSYRRQSSNLKSIHPYKLKPKVIFNQLRGAQRPR